MENHQTKCEIIKNLCNRVCLCPLTAGDSRTSAGAVRFRCRRCRALQGCERARPGQRRRRRSSARHDPRASLRRSRNSRSAGTPTHPPIQRQHIRRFNANTFADSTPTHPSIRKNRNGAASSHGGPTSAPACRPARPLPPPSPAHRRQRAASSAPQSHRSGACPWGSPFTRGRVR